MAMNRELFARAHIRYNNHSELADSLKEVNQIVQRAAKLRGLSLEVRLRKQMPPPSWKVQNSTHQLLSGSDQDQQRTNPDQNPNEWSRLNRKTSLHAKIIFSTEFSIYRDLECKLH